MLARAVRAALMSFARNAASVGLLTLFSRLLGFARDTMMAAALGAGPVADAFVVAFRLPGLVRRLLAEGAVNTAFVPLHGEAERDGQGGAYADAVFTVVTLGFSLLTVLALIAMPLVVAGVAPGFAEGGGRVDLAVTLSRITFGYCLATALMVIASAVLNVHGRFLASAAAPTLVNVLTILALLAVPRLGIIREEAIALFLSYAVLAGGIAQAGLVFVALRRAGLALRLVRPRLSGPVRSFFRLALPGMAAAGVAQVNAFVGLVVASPEPGAVTWLYYADRVYQLPLGIVSVAIGIALLPEIARHSAGGDQAAERSAFSRASEFGVFLSLPATLALILAAHPIVAVLFEHGVFTAADTRETAYALALYAVGLPAFVGARLIQPLFFARLWMRPPFIAALIGVAADIGFSIALFPAWHQAGIAAAAAISGWLNLVLLALLAGVQGLLGLDAAARRRLPRLMLAGAAMAVLVAAASPAVEAWSGPDHPLWQRLLALALLCGGGLLAFVVAGLGLGGLDAAALRAAFKRRADPAP